ncbi:MAG: hypothetical protein M0T84_15095 [Betaproteobacteria bacterium]|nr:hypothetical protein [Betaproteobacteria bacterium]
MTAIALRRSGVLLGFLFAVCHAPQTPAITFSSAQLVSGSALRRDRRTVENFLARTHVQKALRRLVIRADRANAGIKTLPDGPGGIPAIRLFALPAGGMLGGIDVLVILLIAVLVILAL